MEVAEPWVDCLLEEYFMQVDKITSMLYGDVKICPTLLCVFKGTVHLKIMRSDSSSGHPRCR